MDRHDPGRLAEAFRRVVLRLFVRKELFEAEQAEAMLQWPHSGFHVHDAVWVAGEDRPFALRLARYCARNPVALERLTSEAATASSPIARTRPSGRPPGARRWTRWSSSPGS